MWILSLGGSPNCVLCCYKTCATLTKEEMDQKEDWVEMEDEVGSMVLGELQSIGSSRGDQCFEDEPRLNLDRRHTNSVVEENRLQLYVKDPTILSNMLFEECGNMLQCGKVDFLTILDKTTSKISRDMDSKKGLKLDVDRMATSPNLW